eukprot:120803_1
MGVSSSVDRKSIRTTTTHSTAKSSISLISPFSSSTSGTKSRSQSIVNCSSTDSLQSCTLSSRRSLSYDNENAIISIQPNNNRDRNQSWRLRLVPKYRESSLTDSQYIVFGMCNKALLDSGYKHKWYGYGYSVTYCQGFKLTSYVTSFKVGSIITIKYNKEKRQITIWCDGKKKKRFINVQHHPIHEYAFTIKSYSDEYAIQMT